MPALDHAPRSFLPRRVLVATGSPTPASMIARLQTILSPDIEYRGVPFHAASANDLAWADTYVGFRPPPLASLSAPGAMGGVRWVHCTGAGVDAWLYPDELSNEIFLTKSSERFGPMIAEWALARALMFTQHVRLLDAQQARHEWSDPGISFLRGTTAIVLGTGDVGAEIARAFHALGARTVGVSRTGRGPADVFDALHRVDELAAIVGDAQWLVLAAPLTAATHHLVDRALLSQCHGLVLINAGRGAVVDEVVLPEALDAGWLSGAALDVFEVEPLPTTSPLWDDPRVIVSPHRSGPSTLDGSATGFVECVRSLEANAWPALTVDRARGY